MKYNFVQTALQKQLIMLTILVNIVACTQPTSNSDDESETPTLRQLNDTGARQYTQTFSQEDTEDPIVGTLLSDTPDTVLAPGQDADFGRDVTNNNATDGKLGFHFVKLDANGIALTDQQASYDTTPWSCVEDKVTGLIWEVKTLDDLQHRYNRYTWYQPDNYLNGGHVGFLGSTLICRSTLTSCDTHEYILAINALNNGSGLCGLKSWRLPTREELRSIVDYGSTSGLAIDTDFFPNTTPSDTWTSETSFVNQIDGIDAWEIHFDTGKSEQHSKGSTSVVVRLVYAP